MTIQKLKGILSDKMTENDYNEKKSVKRFLDRNRH